MSLAAGASLLSGIGMLGANLAPFVEIGQGHAYQREQMQWARRAYCLDSRALRIDLLNAVKEDVRDHHQTYASRIDTLLVVHTLLLTYALATLQYSNEFLPSSSCTDCEEAENPLLVTVWVYSVSAILILPFWGIVMLIWSKLRLDQWLETSLGRLNTELRSSLAPEPTFLDREEIEMSAGAMRSAGPDPDAQVLLEKVEQAVTRLGGFVVEHQESFKVVWNKETRWMISAATFFLWASCILAILITSGMFWLFLENNMTHKHRHAAWHFATCTACGLCAPGFYVVWYKCCSAREADPPEVFEDCIEPLPSPRRRAESQDPSSVPRHRSLRQSAARTLGAIGQWSGRSRNFNDESDAFLRGQTLREAPAVAEFQLQPFSSMPAGAETWQDIDLGHQ